MKYLFTLLLTIFIISNSFAQTQKANINTSRSNIKKGIKIAADTLQQNKGYDASHRLTRGTSSSIKNDSGSSTDSLQQKANINTSRSNTKGGLNKPNDSLQQKANHNTARSNKNNIKGDGGNPKDSLQQKANINTSRSNIKKNK